MNIYKILLFIIYIFSISLYSETTVPYHWPVKGHEVLTGSFGEFRRYNFHMGTDFATEGMEGIPILALTKGKVVKLQSLRYSIGNAVWLEHDDGFTSRYGHMQRFSDEILQTIQDENILKKIKFREDFEYVPSSNNQIKLERGQTLGYSGKTGIGPPHLHIDLLLGDTSYNLGDFLDLKSQNTKLALDYVELLPMNQGSFINGKNKPLKIEFIDSEDNFLIPKQNEAIHIQGEIGVKVAAHERTGGGNRLGMRYIGLKVNDKLYQEIDIRRIYQPHTIQSCFVFDNYSTRMNGKPFKYFLYSRGNSSLENLRFRNKGNGLLVSDRLEKDVKALVQVEIKGTTGKKLTASFRIQKDEEIYPLPKNLYAIKNVFPDIEKTFISNDKNVELRFGKEAIFVEDFFSLFKNESLRVQNPGMVLLSEVYSVYPDHRDFNKGYEMYFKFPHNFNLYPEKVGLYLLNYKGNPVRLVSSKPIEKGLFHVTLRHTGHFAVMEDHFSPRVWVHRWKSGQTLSKNSQIFIKAGDVGSGVSENGITVVLDGESARLDYDPDLSRWELFYPETFNSSGSHTLELTAQDRAGNQSEKVLFEYKIP